MHVRTPYTKNVAHSETAPPKIISIKVGQQPRAPQRDDIAHRPVILHGNIRAVLPSLSLAPPYSRLYRQHYKPRTTKNEQSNKTPPVSPLPTNNTSHRITPPPHHFEKIQKYRTQQPRLNVATCSKLHTTSPSTTTTYLMTQPFIFHRTRHSNRPPFLDKQPPQKEGIRSGPVLERLFYHLPPSSILFVRGRGGVNKRLPTSRPYSAAKPAYVQTSQNLFEPSKQNTKSERQLVVQSRSE